MRAETMLKGNSETISRNYALLVCLLLSRLLHIQATLLNSETPSMFHLPNIWVMWLVPNVGGKILLWIRALSRPRTMVAQQQSKLVLNQHLQPSQNLIHQNQ